MNCSDQILTEARRPKLTKTNQMTRWPQLILFSKAFLRFQNVVKQLEERFIYFRWSLDECPAEGPKKSKRRQLASCFNICTMLSFPSHEAVYSQS
ncbi:hypothetical protein F2Q70_00017483 [Brassica cretica]|uniref:Uncharacterized protein n=1 Tax=Brassica cretica TaxID=69181 RepID=A0A8S9I5R0_BRACR|nr:hypothetical protein F2Q70_00017483 [Brassica cretica]KAF2599348.1 hypothetical protein F2Q68_00010441 [Brassica cretica]